MMKQTGMTLTSVLVAVALTSALAMAVSKLVSNQARLNKIMDLTDQRDMITRFYSALMHNRAVWECTLYDTSNSTLLDYISNTTGSFSGGVELRTPDCKFKEKFLPEGIEERLPLTATHGTGDHYRSSDAFFDDHNPMLLGNSLTEHDANGWWEVELAARPVAKGSIDLILTINFDEDNYKAAHANFNPPDIRDSVEYRVRKGDPNLQGTEHDCGNHAVVAIADLATGIRGVSCSIDPLVDVPSLMHSSPSIANSGNFLHTLATGSDTRVGGGRTGLQYGAFVHNVHHAIADISMSGAYDLAPVGRNPDGTPKAGVLGFERGSTACTGGYVAGDVSGVNLPALSEITGGTPRWSDHLGPQGKQGIPGPPGYKGPPGDPGPPATCPATPPSCS